MGRYDEDYGVGNATRQKDLVLNMNEFAHILSKTDGNIKCAVGPFQTSLSAQETLVLFNTKTKKFEECPDYDRAKQLFVSAPEGWYAVLKNPVPDGKYPETGRATIIPQNVEIGKKVNIIGPASFALYPGQMARVIKGHRLRSNQYLLARVYDAQSANANAKSGVVTDANGDDAEIKTDKYYAGQLLVIKGTEVSFYIPPTGIEVLAIDAEDGRSHGDDNYVRDAVTLERLEYCILKDEDGNKRYLHGPAVVFPKPTETFVESAGHSVKYRAIELSKISGIYIKVIAEYTEKENGVDVVHPIGEELFITGDNQMIYYPRPEHAIINYDNKFMHHAIAIPAGEGRYIMNRLTGEITTAVGPKMYLPDPRTEVVVKRKLTPNQCELWFPGNREVLAYNGALTEASVEKSMKARGVRNDISAYCSTVVDSATMDMLESNAGISRGTSYTKPRTITLDNKYDGVVGIDIWTGYAVNVVSKTGNREIIVGPTTRLLNYDETLEVLELSTGRPKTTDNLLKTVYLRVENNKISDLINVQTKDFVDVQIKVSYCVDFLEKYKDKWFSVENYVKYLCDRERSLLKREAKKYTIEEFYANASDIVRNIALDIPSGDGDRPSPKCGRAGRFFEENGMLVHDVEVLSVAVERQVAQILEAHQEEIIRKTLELSDAEQRIAVAKKLAEAENTEAKLRHDNKVYALNLEQELKISKFKNEEDLRRKNEAAEKASAQAKSDIQGLLDSISKAERDREQARRELQIEMNKKEAEVEAAAQKAYADTVAEVMKSVSPDLIAAMTSSSNAEMITEVAKSISPYAIAKNESVADFTNKLLRGTNLEDVLGRVMPKENVKY